MELTSTIPGECAFLSKTRYTVSYPYWEVQQNQCVAYLNTIAANYWFLDVQNILTSEGENEILPLICSAQPSNITEGSSPIKSIK